MSRESVNNPQLMTNSGVVSLSIPNQKRNLGGFNQIIFSVINNYILSFSSFLDKVKVKINGF